MKKLRIVLADDHEMLREGLRTLINSQADMEVAGEAENGRIAVSLAERLEPDVVVMDISLPELNGFEATAGLTQSRPQIKILALTRHADDGYLKQFFQAGARGYVLKNSAAGELIRAIRQVVAGNTYVDPKMTQHVVESAVGRRPLSGPDVRKTLTRREEDVLRETARGYANKEIAARLRISVKTVETHKSRAMQKMGMTSRIDIVRYGRLQGWLDDL